MKGKFYGVGTGPGDPELITVKAVRILRSADIVFVPDSGRDRESIALEIAGEYLDENTEVVNLTFPMTYDSDERVKNRRENAAIILSAIESGKTAVFLTLGDPMLYSTYIYMLESLSASGVEIETVPGVTSFAASAAASNTPLAAQNEELRVVPLDKDTDIARHLEEGENTVFMKVSSDNKRLADEIKGSESELECVIVSRCGRDGETIGRDINILYGEVPYMTTLIVKKKKFKS